MIINIVIFEMNKKWKKSKDQAISSLEHQSYLLLSLLCVFFFKISVYIQHLIHCLEHNGPSNICEKYIKYIELFTNTPSLVENNVWSLTTLQTMLPSSLIFPSTDLVPNSQQSGVVFHLNGRGMITYTWTKECFSRFPYFYILGPWIFTWLFMSVAWITSSCI